MDSALNLSELKTQNLGINATYSAFQVFLKVYIRVGACLIWYRSLLQFIHVFSSSALTIKSTSSAALCLAESEGHVTKSWFTTFLSPSGLLMQMKSVKKMTAMSLNLSPKTTPHNSGCSRKWIQFAESFKITSYFLSDIFEIIPRTVLDGVACNKSSYCRPQGTSSLFVGKWQERS